MFTTNMVISLFLRYTLFFIEYFDFRDDIAASDFPMCLPWLESFPLGLGEDAISTYGVANI